MLYNKRNLNIVKFTGKKTSSWQVDALRIGPDYTMATNGNVMVIVHCPKRPKMSFKDIRIDPIHVHKKDAIAMRRELDKDPLAYVSPVDGDTFGGPAFAVLSRGGMRVFRVNPGWGGFPVVPVPSGKPVFEVCVRGNDLAEVLKFLSGFRRDHKVKLFFWENRVVYRAEAYDSDEDQSASALLSAFPEKEGHPQCNGQSK